MLLAVAEITVNFNINCCMYDDLRGPPELQLCSLRKRFKPY